MKFFTRQPNPVFSPEYHALVSVLIAARKRAGVTQRSLAAGLAKSPSHVQRIESGQRRIDVLELYRMAPLLGREPAALFSEMALRLDELKSPTRITEEAGCGKEPSGRPDAGAGDAREPLVELGDRRIGGGEDVIVDVPLDLAGAHG